MFLRSKAELPREKSSASSTNKKYLLGAGQQLIVNF